MQSLRHDLALAFRSLRRGRSVTVVAMVTLALGLGASTAIFSAVDGILLRPLSFPDSQRLVSITTVGPDETGNGSELSWPNVSDIRDGAKTLESAAWHRVAKILYSDSGSERLLGVSASASLFDVLGVEPILGRVFESRDVEPGADKVMVISHRAWQSLFRGDRAIVGRAVRTSADGEMTTVIGVMPPTFQFPFAAEESEFWAPLEPGLSSEEREGRDLVFLNALARLRPGGSLSEANAELATIANRLAKAYPDTNTGTTFALRPFQETIVGNVSRPLWILFGAVVLVLLIGCANVANLLLARATARTRDIAVRMALGASQRRIARQMLLESVLLGAFAGVAGLGLGHLAIRALVAVAPSNVPRIASIQFDWRVFAFGFLASLLTGLVFGAAPALVASRTDIESTLRASGTRGGTSGRSSNLLRNSLVVTEVAISLVLFVAAGLLIVSFWKISQIDPGFDAWNATDVYIAASSLHRDDQSIVDFYDDVTRSVSETPGIERVAMTKVTPFMNGALAWNFVIEGRDLPPPGQVPSEAYVVVSADYFDTIGIPLIRGREFTRRDDADAPAVCVVSESFVRRYFPNEQPLGRRLLVQKDSTASREIVGVVGDVRRAELALDPLPTIYVPFSQDVQRGMHLIARSRIPEALLLSQVKEALHRVDPMQPIIIARSFEEIADRVSRPARTALGLLIALASIAFALTAIGIYGVVSYTVRQRYREFGVRMALGARGADIGALVVRHVGRLLVAGTLIGVVAAVLASRILRRFLYEVSATDPTIFAAATAAVIVAGVAVGLIPAARAANVDAVSTIRDE